MSEFEDAVAGIEASVAAPLTLTPPGQQPPAIVSVAQQPPATVAVSTPVLTPLPPPSVTTTTTTTPMVATTVSTTSVQPEGPPMVATVVTPPPAQQPVALPLTTGTVAAVETAPAKVRWVCFKRVRKLIFFGFLFLVAMATIVVIFCASADILKWLVLALMIVVALAMFIEYYWLGVDCSVDPVTNSIGCAKNMA